MKAVLITGNPLFINNDVARAYYAAIVDYLTQRGVEVIMDKGKPDTCPPQADFYIGHSRGADRVVCFESQPGLGIADNFLRFGVIGGYIHPKDEEWQSKSRTKFSDPPEEHFEFIQDQKDAIDRMIAKILFKPAVEVPNMPARVIHRQSPGNRPRPR
ncbi:hypothetical protein AVT69_gp363 [Pseudomonas phage PhiPA3]|uniref:Uncharacterized protein 373 n=1 Tax=Pseudomonas phage PhiPA3 TaxID=998086 RepID=F8SJK5_BPPA3|nr:hypothetical protein AVT69_gp363 [Pseudomonas phage PhiPA3]AEH03796.1 hypothetical protein [Pseudomonas phage PhiPA3]